MAGRIDFDRINGAAMSDLRPLLAQWLPNGKIVGHEYVALNPRRADKHLGSFKISLTHGCWADFATGDKGGDPVSLFAFLNGLSQGEAAWRLAAILGVSL